MTTNILIVGNGFDLSHYLPTKYDHFMVVMQAIENWDTQKGDMNFDDLFDLNHKKEGWFFKKTKEIYDTDEIKISIDQVSKLKEQLKENVWYQYFSEHVRQVQTWIDFETKIDEVLLSLSKGLPYFVQMSVMKKTSFQQSKLINEIGTNNYDILNSFKLFGTAGIGYQGFNNKFCDGEKAENGFSSIVFLNFLQFQLENFIEIFNHYLKLIINKFECKAQFKVIEKHWQQLNEIYSFNYTNTFQSFYQQQVNTEFLHGKLGENQNIVLGIDDLNSDELKKLKAYGFTKYHQKLFKDTDYLFLDSYKSKVKVNKKKIEYFEKDFVGSSVDRGLYREQIMELESKLDLTFYIWGHSLDVSDKDYIIDLFSLNDDIDRNVRVVIYYFNPNAKFSLLNNLLAILEKDKVEHWMKNRWLKFEENPQIDFGITETQCSTS